MERGQLPACLSCVVWPRFLSLDLVDLLVSAGTPREAVEQLLWVERLQQAKRVENLAEYSPAGHRAGIKNDFFARIISRDGAFCTAELGSETWCMLAFSDAETLAYTREEVEAFETLSVIRRAFRYHLSRSWFPG